MLLTPKKPTSKKKQYLAYLLCFVSIVANTGAFYLDWFVSTLAVCSCVSFYFYNKINTAEIEKRKFARWYQQADD